MISPELLEILACPETKQPVRLADSQLVENLNRLIGQGKLINQAGELVKEKMDGALVREDGRFLYPIIDDIPVMLIDKAIPLDQAQGK